MTKYRMLAALLAGLILMSLTGCVADKETADQASDIQSQEFSTADVISDVEIADKTTAESEPVKDTVSTAVTEKPAEKESDTPQSRSSPSAKNEVSEASKPAPSEPPKQTEPPKPEESTPADPPVTTPPPEPEPSEPEPTETPAPAFDIDYWISYAQNYATSIGLRLESSAVECWDNPIIAGAHCTYLERDIKSRLGRYSQDKDITDVWIWSESRPDGSYDLYIGYA